MHREIKLGTWNVRRFYRTGYLKAAARELARNKLDVGGCRRSGWTKRHSKGRGL